MLEENNAEFKKFDLRNTLKRVYHFIRHKKQTKVELSKKFLYGKTFCE